KQQIINRLIVVEIFMLRGGAPSRNRQSVGSYVEPTINQIIAGLAQRQYSRSQTCVTRQPGHRLIDRAKARSPSGRIVYRLGVVREIHCMTLRTSAVSMARKLGRNMRTLGV